MILRRTLLPLVLLGACARPAALPLAVSVARTPEVRTLPPDPAEEPLPDGTPAGEWIEPLEEGSCFDRQRVNAQAAPCPARSGLLVSEGRAVRDGMYRSRYRELRTLYTADRTVWGAHRELYETERRLADQRLRSLEPSWWERNALPLGIVGGFVIGVLGTAAIVYVAQ